jgi:hypothetical protein
MEIAVRFMEVDQVNAFQRSAVALLFFVTNRRTAKGNAICFQPLAVTKQRQPARAFLDQDAICLQIADAAAIAKENRGEREQSGPD